MRVLDAGAEGHPASDVGLAASGRWRLAAGAALTSPTAVVPGAWGADGGDAVRPAALGVTRDFECLGQPAMALLGDDEGEMW
jgi:hypothetical protein